MYDSFHFIQYYLVYDCHAFSTKKEKRDPNTATKALCSSNSNNIKRKYASDMNEMNTQMRWW